MIRKRVTSIVLLAALGAGVTAYATAHARTDRADCPGKIVCPLTGELVCKDRCPISEPVNSDQRAELPACCRGR